MIRAVIDRYPALDTLSTWTLGATGLAAVFLFTNYEKLSAYLKPGAISCILGLFIVSILAGLFQKFYAVRLECISKLDDQVTAQATAAFNSLATRSALEKGIQVQINLPIELQLPAEICREIYGQIGAIVETAMTEFKNSAPWPFSRFIQSGIDASKTNILHGLKLGNTLFFRQFIALIVQLVALVLTLVVCFVESGSQLVKIMSHEKLSSLISIGVALLVFFASFFKWYDVAWNGPALIRQWVLWLFGLCIALLVIAAVLLFV